MIFGLGKLEEDVINQKMKLSFREYILNEAKQVGYIFHFTTLSKILNIVKDKKLKKGNEQYVSLTRDFQLPNEKGYFGTGEYIVRIVIDGNKLSENTKIKPVKDIKYNDEREEGVTQDINIKYIESIEFLTSDLRIFPKESIEAVYNKTKQLFSKTKYIKKFQPYKGNK